MDHSSSAISFGTKFDNNLYTLKLQLYLIFFYWMWILTNSPLYYIFFLIYITQACKISRKSKINSYIIYQMFKFQVFCSLKLFIKNKFMDWIINNIWLTQNLTYVFFLRTFDMCIKNINNMQFKIFKIRSHIMFFFSGSCSLKLQPSL